MKTKIFMICSVWHEDYIRELLEGMNRRIGRDDIELHVFASYDTSGDLDFQRKEQEIFSLPDLDDYDGILIASNSEGNVDVIREKLDRYKQKGKKVLSIERELEDVSYMGINNYVEFYRLVEHLLRDHGCKTLNFLGGPKENEENQERFRAFCDCMEKYNVPVEPERVIYRRFLHSDGAPVYQEWKKKGLHVPDAVVCANDNMALGYCDAAAEDGYFAPESFLITGFDNFDEGQYFHPSITSVNRNWVQLGYDSMDKLLAMIQEDIPRGIFRSRGKLALNESCGCGLNKRNISEDFRIVYHGKKQEEWLHEKQRLNRHLLCISKSVKEMQGYLAECFKRLGIDDMAICINKSVFEEDSSKSRTGYEREVYMITAEKQLEVSREQTFEPQYLNMIGHSRIYLFSSLHLVSDTYGYAVAPYTEILMNNGVHKMFMQTLSLALENIRQRQELGRMNRRLEQLYVQDPMTGLYNRFGYYNLAEKYLQKHKEEAYLIYMDMDNLKVFNDRYGHAMGDKAIKGMAEVIKTVFEPDSICVRMGGDEFLVMTCCASEEELMRQERRLLELLEKYSVANELPIPLKTSIGHTACNEADEPLEVLVKKADARMYEAKQKRKGEEI